ncbi:mechanosensitive ion channel family protein [Cardiobacteriaceae bacterium TAE3-ERU3]|nr:mechanosensitive ion channel family protein [Cardiobacteriaceae bacterium TAE3-ERU3]
MAGSLVPQASTENNQVDAAPGSATDAGVQMQEVSADLDNSTTSAESVVREIDFTDVDQILGIDTLNRLWSEQIQPLIDHFWSYLPFMIASVILVLVYSVVFWVIRHGLNAVMKRVINDRDKRKVAKQVVKLLVRLTWLMVCAVTILAFMPFIEGYIGAIVRAYILLLILLVTWASVHYFIRVQARRRELDESLTLLMKNIVRILLLLVGIYLIFRQFGVNLLPILGGLGVLGLAVGFAAQDILANFISGITLLIDRPFKIGDWIRTNDHEGRVKGLTLRTTRIRTRSNEYVSIPNKDLAGSVVTNLSHGGPLRIDIEIATPYHADIAQVREILLGVVESHDAVLARPAPMIVVHEIQNNALQFWMRIWLPEDEIGRYPFLKMELLEQAKNALNQKNIGYPLPHYALDIQDGS